MMDIVPATREHIVALYGNVPGTVRAVAVVDGDKTLGVAGIYKDDGRDVVFAKLTEALRPHKRVIVIAARRVMAMLNREAYAICDKRLETADGFMRHFGFKPIANEVYQWTA